MFVSGVCKAVDVYVCCVCSVVICVNNDNVYMFCNYVFFCIGVNFRNALVNLLTIVLCLCFAAGVGLINIHLVYETSLLVSLMLIAKVFLCVWCECI